MFFLHFIKTNLVYECSQGSLIFLSIQCFVVCPEWYLNKSNNKKNAMWLIISDLLDTYWMIKINQKFKFEFYTLRIFFSKEFIEIFWMGLKFRMIISSAEISFWLSILIFLIEIQSAVWCARRKKRWKSTKTRKFLFFDPS